MKQKLLMAGIAIFLIAVAWIGAATTTDAHGSATDDEQCHGLGLGHRHHDDDGDGVDDKKGNGHHKLRCDDGDHGNGAENEDGEDGGDDDD
jgi:hypothetical protein